MCTPIRLLPNWRLSVPSALATDTSVVATFSGINPGDLVELYKGTDCSAANVMVALWIFLPTKKIGASG